jgi:hypothetical protein
MLAMYDVDIFPSLIELLFRFTCDSHFLAVVLPGRRITNPNILEMQV